MAGGSEKYKDADTHVLKTADRGFKYLENCDAVICGHPLIRLLDLFTGFCETFTVFGQSILLSGLTFF